MCQGSSQADRTEKHFTTQIVGLLLYAMEHIINIIPKKVEI